ncbi:ABC transporter substrate binding protein [Desulfosporosinus sp. PR]|uniref:ABC transporter substrate-binding protein n=1 Tax=Candidatus Desulfosporosinus nitrosoreducens TaxID=3401928 RepID=UPI0027EBEF74|nr:ABC transporter substrate binding protein [Desulfosporosinus sp. PR]MDQ7096740.1 ABC transporter substrate binding protein [Desulfosporosinus sp. PR]
MKDKGIILRKFFITFLVTALFVSGCSSLSTLESNQVQNQKKVDISSESGLHRFPSAPVKKPGGGKFRIAYVDINPYPVTGSMLYYVIENLKQDGWLNYDSLPFNADNVDAKALVDWLAKQDLGQYAEFNTSTNYYLADQGEAAVAQSLRKHVQNHEIDLVFAMGTWPGQFVKKLNLGVPLLVYGSVDPIGSGIIKSATDSGDKNIWAKVDPAAFTRQLQFYYDTIHFKNIGMVFNNEIIDSIPDYEKAAKANGFKITAIKIPELTSSNPADIRAYYANLKNIYQNMIQNDKIDAYLINTNIITDDSKIKDLFSIFYQAKIPIFVQAGDNFVKNGALILLSPQDYIGSGAFVASTIGSIFNGAKPGNLSQEYVSSPYLSLNLDTAETIGFTPSFEMLLSCEHIYTSQKQ